MNYDEDEKHPLNIELKYTNNAHFPNHRRIYVESKLKELLHRFLDSKDPTEVEHFFAEQTKQFDDPDATALCLTPICSGKQTRLYPSTLRSMHFEIPDTETSTFIFEAERYRSMGKLGKEEWQPFEMKDTQLLRTVALKQLHQQKVGSTYEHENFIVEAQITAQLQHPELSQYTIFKLMRMVVSTLRCERLGSNS